jgi:predicted outer membrane lipoprotein
MNNDKARWLTGVLLAAAFAAFSPAYSDTTFGVRTGLYTDASAGFVGGEVVTSIASGWYFNPNLEVALAGSHDVVTANGDFHYDFFQDRPYWVWAGGGPAVIHRENPTDANRTDLGVNFLGGIAWKTSEHVSPYLQGKVTLSDSDEAVLAFGLRF